MCGHVGAFGLIDTDIEQAVAELLIVDVVRGKDSTGMGIVSTHKKSKPLVIKDTYLPLDLLHDKKFINAIKNQNRLMMGHNRHATKGEITQANAHPFQKKHIMLNHNGTVHNYRVERERNIDSDSELLTVQIAEDGIEETWKNISDYSAATLTFWDNREKTFNIITDGKRPFAFVYTEKMQTLLWASELWMLRGIVERKKIKIAAWPDGGKGKASYRKPTKDILYTFKYKNGKVDYTTTTIPKVIVSRIYTSNNGTENWYKKDWWDEEQEQHDLNIIEGLETEWINWGGNVVPFLVKSAMTKEEFNSNEWLHSCLLCGADVKKEYTTLRIIDENVAVCDDCVRNNGKDIVI